MSILYIIFIVTVSIIICASQIPSMLKNKEMMDFWASTLLLALGTTLAVLKAVDVKLPNPSTLLEYICLPISEFMSEFFKEIGR